MPYAKGNKPANVGRPKGAKTLVKVIEYFTKEEVVDFFEDLKKRSKTDSKIALYLAEQMTGKAPQAMNIEMGGNITITFDKAFHDPTPKTT